MSRRVRHVHARNGEWVVVHRDSPSDNSGCGCLVVIFIILLLGGC